MKKNNEKRGKNHRSSEKSNSKSDPKRREPASFPYPLNKYLAHCGVSSRRKAVEYIKAGEVQVNNKTIIEPGFQVQQEDKVTFRKKRLELQQNFEYFLLNKPKDCLTTTKDPRGRRTVMHLMHRATKERIYPVGRLDRNTRGLLLITNDGDLAQQLSHPSGKIKKLYHVTLDKPLTKGDFNQVLEGVALEDGLMAADALAFVDQKDKTQIGLEIHSGKNRIVRRIFEHLGYEVTFLDRVMYAGLTKKNLPRGKWRKLSDRELRSLKQNSGRKREKKKRKKSS